MVTRCDEPIRDDLVESHAFALGKAPVRDVSERGVSHAPAEGAHALFAHDDLRVLQLVELLDGRIRVDVGQLVDLEGVAEDGGAPGERAETRGERVEPSGDDRLHRRWEGPAHAPRAAVALREEHAGRLDDEEGIPAGALRDLGSFLVRDQTASGLPRQVDRLLHGERVHPKQHRVDRVRSPGGSLVEELGPREREGERSTLAAARMQAHALDQVLHGPAERVDVLDDHHERLHRGHAVDERQEPGLHVVDERGFVAPFGDAEQQTQPIGDPVDLALIDVAAGGLAEALPDLVGGVAVVDPCKVADHGRQGSERGRLRVGTGAGHEHRHVFVETGGELVGEAGLPDAGLAGDGDQRGRAGRGRVRQALAQDGQLARTADERDGAARRTRRDALDEIRGKIEREPLGADVPQDPERDLGLGERVGGLSREHLSRAGGRLEPCGGVHDGSRDEELSRRPHPCCGDAGFDADANPERLRESERAAQTAETAADRQAGAHRAERVVLVDRGQSEHGHHGVADELLRTPSEGLQLLGRGVEERAEDLAGALGVQTLPETGGIDEVGEEDGDHLAFLGAERGRHRRPAVGAEARAGRERMAAHRTIHPRSIGRVPDARMPHRGG